MLINQIMSMIKVCKPEKKIEKRRKKSIFLDLLNDPDNFKLELYTENDEIVMKIKRNERKEEESIT